MESFKLRYFNSFEFLDHTGFSSRDFRDLEMLMEFLLELLLPIVGIVLEISSRKSAKWVNIGSLTFAGAFWLAEAVWWRSDPFFGVLLIMSFGLFILAGLTTIIYRATKAQEEVQASAP